MNELTLTTANPLTLVNGDKDSRYRLNKYTSWLTSVGRPWHIPDLAAYRDYLLSLAYAPATISSHLSTVRARYEAIIRDRDLFFEMAARSAGKPLAPADLKAMADEAIVRVKNAIHPDAARVKQITKQDRTDSEHLRLTVEQANDLMNRPGVDTIQGLRDTAIIALALCTGIREAELCALEVNDLRQRLGGELAIHVRKGKGNKERLVPYGNLSWVLVIVDCWLESAGIIGGPVFRGFYKDGKSLRPGGLSVRAAQYILESYPVVIDGKVTQVRFHDLRRTYARRMYDKGVDLLGIRENLGHASEQTTLGYIGKLDADQRRPPKIFSFDLGRLEKR